MKAKNRNAGTIRSSRAGSIPAPRTKKKAIKVRKNGEHAVDARSTMRLPTGSLQRILRRQAAYRWMMPGIGTFTPRYIEQILNGALAGNHVQQWELFDMMLRTWPVLGACVQELCYGVTRRELVYDPFRLEDEKATASAVEREKLVTISIQKMNPDPAGDENGINKTISDIMDGWFRGVSVLEILWQPVDTKDGVIIGPKSTFWAHPCSYAFNQEGVLGLTNDSYPTGYGSTSRPYPAVVEPFPPDKFLIAMHKAKSGNPLSGPMLVPLAWWWCATNFSSDWLLNLAQLFGLPFRFANYAASTPEETVNIICQALADMGSAGWAAFPEGTTLEFKEPSTLSSGHTPQGDLLNRADEYARLLILGQTMTGQTIASGRGGQSFGTVEAQLKQDRLDAACLFVQSIINRQLIPAILRQNYGDADEAPTCRFLQETEGTYQDAQRDQILATLGLPIPYSHLRKKYNIPERTGDEEVTKPPPKPVAPSSVTSGPAGTRPTGQVSKNPAPNPKEAAVKSKLDEISLIQDPEIFARELKELAIAIATKENHEEEN
jgi:phage gp29-like protein